MQQNFVKTLSKIIEDDCPEIASIINDPQGDWYMADAKELNIQLTIALQEAYKLGRLHGQIYCAEVLTSHHLDDASDIIRDLSINED